MCLRQPSSMTQYAPFQLIYTLSFIPTCLLGLKRLSTWRIYCIRSKKVCGIVGCAYSHWMTRVANSESGKFLSVPPAIRPSIASRAPQVVKSFPRGLVPTLPSPGLLLLHGGQHLLVCPHFACAACWLAAGWHAPCRSQTQGSRPGFHNVACVLLHGPLFLQRCRAKPPAGGARGGTTRAGGAARQRTPTRRRKEWGRRCGLRGRAFPGRARARVSLGEVYGRAHTTARLRKHRFRSSMQNRASQCPQLAESYTGWQMRAILPCLEISRRAHAPLLPTPAMQPLSLRAGEKSRRSP